MRLYWYWPHPHSGPSPLALAALRPGDELVVQALPTLHGVEYHSVAEYEVVRDLPDPTRTVRGPRRWFRPVELTWKRSTARRRLSRQRFDVAFIEALVYQVDWLDLRSLAKRVPVATLVHDVRPHRHSYPAKVEDRLLRLLYSDRCTGHLIVFSEILKQELIDGFDVAPERISVIPHWLDASDLRQPELPTPSRPFALFFGRLEQYKGLDVLLEAAAELGADAAFDVLIAGDGSEQQKQKIRNAAMSTPAVRAELGRVTGQRKAELFSTASLVVLPYSEFHSFSGVLADAYAYRLPVLVSAVDTLAAIVREDGTGWVSPTGDPTALAEAMTQAFDEITIDSSIVGRLERAATRHDHSKVGPMLRGILTTAVDQHRRRG